MHKCPSKFWNTINQISGHNRVSSVRLPPVAALGRQFSSVVGTIETAEFDSSQSQKQFQGSTNLSYFLTINELEVHNLLSKLDVNKASGWDEVEAKYLKIGAAAIAPSLTALFDTSLAASELPEDWKCAKITPIFKSGARNDPKNYRPISLLPIVSKLLEQSVFNTLSRHLEANSLLPECQYGYRKGRSTQDAVSILADDLLEAKDNRRCSGVVLLDVQKAFDTVNHCLLLRKLSLGGVDGSAHRWFSDYLTGGRQFVKVGDDISLKVPVVRGVPQGSKLGPSLFNYYTGDLPSAVTKSSLILFADDSCLYTSGKSFNEVTYNLQFDLNSLSDWYQHNTMSLNEKKSELLLFKKFRDSSMLSNYSVTICETSLKQTDSARYLGVIFDKSLNWRPQLDAVVRKSGRKIGILYRCHHLLDHHSRLAIVKSVIRPDLDYCAVVWNNGTAGIAKRIQRIEKRFLRVLSGLKLRESTGNMSSVFSKFGLQSHQARHSFYLGTLAHRCLHSLAPNIVNFLYHTLENHQYHTRLTQSGLHMPNPNTEALRQSSFYRAQKFWNSLSCRLRIVSKVSDFKQCLRKFCYTVDDI